MKYEADDFQGLTPAVDARKSEKLFALEGQKLCLRLFWPSLCFW
jgi:hypothetical protein